MDDLQKLLENAGVQVNEALDSGSQWKEVTDLLVTVIGRELMANPTDDTDTAVKNLLRMLYTDVRMKISQHNWPTGAEDELSMVPMDTDDKTDVQSPGQLDFPTDRDPWGQGK